MTQPAVTPASTEPLQFDRAVTKDGAEKGPGVTCSMCERTIVDRYYTLGDQPTCLSCKAKVEREAADAKRPAVFLRSATYGFGAAIAGAALYYAVMKLLSLEIGLIAIACGFMVGYAMRKGARGWGGRRFQLAAASLTYLSVGMAYFPIAMEGAKDQKPGVTADSTSVAQQGAPADGDGTAFTTIAAGSIADSGSTPAAASTDAVPGGLLAVLVGFLAVFALSLMLPMLVIFGSMPGGLISALIIGFGIHQAWKMTAAQDLTFHGPLNVSK